MAVNHYLFTNEELIRRLLEVVEGSAYFDGVDDILFSYKVDREYHEILKELHNRMER